eukprot:gene32457-31069_t
MNIHALRSGVGAWRSAPIRCDDVPLLRGEATRWSSSVFRLNTSPSASVHTQASKRVLATDAPCIVATKKLMAGSPGAMSLAQGIVHWGPPQGALKVASDLLLSGDPSISSYGPAEGNPLLRAALKAKVEERNGLQNYSIMVTAGANQAFTNIVLGLMDESDKVVLFKPYYFNHLMAFQMCGGADSVVFGDCDPTTLHPDLDWLQSVLSSPQPPKMVVIVNPCVLLSKEEVQRASDMCAAAGAWLILDNTYEDFLYEGREHFCVGGPHVINVFSFSKLMALAALEQGGFYVKEQIAALEGNRAALVDALSPLGTLGGGSVAGGEGAIYLWARLPPGCEDDQSVVTWLVKKHGVCVIPGSACGVPGHIRAAYANLKPEMCNQAAARLKMGLEELVAKGPAVIS